MAAVWMKLNQQRKLDCLATFGFKPFRNLYTDEKVRRQIMTATNTPLVPRSEKTGFGAGS
jgi:hypothetical protein